MADGIEGLSLGEGTEQPRAHAPLRSQETLALFTDQLSAPLVRFTAIQ
jgi:hypothetical protein